MTLYEIQETMIDNLNIFLESEGSEFDQEVYEEIMNILKTHIVKLIATFLPNELQMVSSSLSTFLALN